MVHPTRAQHVATAARRVRLPCQSLSVQHSRPQSTSKPTKQRTKTFPQSSPFAKSRAVPWVFASITAFGLAFYGSQLVVAARKSSHDPAILDIAQQKDVSGRYDDTADSFDSEVGLSEILMRINSIRKKLARQCTGHVLEVSCGTGRNLGYYDIGPQSEIDSLTFVDLSPQMIDVCKKKWQVLFGSLDTTSRNRKFKDGLIVRFLTGSALERMPSAPNDKKYDTIIQTMGLCSTPSPKQLLDNMIQHLNISNPEARIILLEHGRSYRAWMNNILDGAAEKHAEIHGCWFNRDIGALVDEAARQNGLKVVNERRYHVGTTWVFELRPDADLVRRMQATEGKAKDAGVDERPPKQSWWSWLGLSME